MTCRSDRLMQLRSLRATLLLVLAVLATSGHADDAANAAATARYKPAVCSDKPCMMEFPLHITFGVEN